MSAPPQDRPVPLIWPALLTEPHTGEFDPVLARFAEADRGPDSQQPTSEQLDGLAALYAIAERQRPSRVRAWLARQARRLRPQVSR